MIIDGRVVYEPESFSSKLENATIGLGKAQVKARVLPAFSTKNSNSYLEPNKGGMLKTIFFHKMALCKKGENAGEPVTSPR